MSETDRSKKASEARAKKKYKKINKAIKKINKSQATSSKESKSSAKTKGDAKKVTNKEFAKNFKKEMRAKHSFKTPEAIKGHKFFWTPEDMERYKKTGKVPKVAKKAVKKGAKKGIAKKVISKLGLPGKVAIGAWTAYDVAKEIGARKSKKGKGKSCKAGSYMSKKGVCVSERRAKK